MPSARADPMAGGNDQWSFTRNGGGPSAAPMAASGLPFGGRQPVHANIGTPPAIEPPRANGRWALYDEKWSMYPGFGKNRYDSKSPQLWLQSTHDYVAGRTSEVDPLLDWAERQVEPITSRSLLGRPGIPMVDFAGTPTAVSQ